MEINYTKVCYEKIEECKKLCKAGNLQGALDCLTCLEKQTRAAGDWVSTVRLVTAICRMCKEASNWSALNAHILLLCKRKQCAEAVCDMVRECCTYLDQISDKETQIALIVTLRQVTEGKMHVEMERATLTHKLAKIREDEGDLKTAASIMQELDLESFRSIGKRERLELILEQMRLCLLQKDYVGAQFISKKVNGSIFRDEDADDLKLKYYRLMILLDEQHEGSYLDLCKHCSAILSTSFIRAIPAERQVTAKLMILYLILSPYDYHQEDMVFRVRNNAIVDEVPLFKKLLIVFDTSELIKWAIFYNDYEKVLKSTTIFGQNESSCKRWTDLRNRCMEHNIRVMGKWYSRLRIARMSEFLHINVCATEDFLAQMISSKQLRAKFDRISGIIHFRHDNKASLHKSILLGVASLSSRVDNISRLINKERCLLMCATDN